MVFCIIAASILHDLIVRQAGNGDRRRHVGYVQLHRAIGLINRTAGHVFVSCRQPALHSAQLFFGSSSATAICKISRSCCLIRQARDFTGITVDSNRVRLPDTDGRSQVDVSSSLIDSEVIRQFSRYGVLLNTIFYCTRNRDAFFTCHIRCRLNGCIVDVNSIGLGLSIFAKAFCNRRIRAIDNFHCIFGNVVNNGIAFIRNVRQIRFGDALNLSRTINFVSITVYVGHGDGTIIIYRIGIGFDMDIFAFSDILNLCCCIIRDIGEVRICQAGSFKLNLTICSSDGNMVTSNKVDFLIDSLDILAASLSRPEIASACQTRRGNLDVSIVINDIDVVAINEVQRSVFRNGLSVSSIDLGCPADIL